MRRKSSKRLNVARSNVSTSLKELQGWGIVKMVHVLGDKRDHFESMKDVWEMFRMVLDERKRREIDPTLLMLRECIAETGGQKDAFTRERLQGSAAISLKPPPPGTRRSANGPPPPWPASSSSATRP